MSARLHDVNRCPCRACVQKRRTAMKATARHENPRGRSSMTVQSIMIPRPWGKAQGRQWVLSHGFRPIRTETTPGFYHFVITEPYGRIIRTIRFGRAGILAHVQRNPGIPETIPGTVTQVRYHRGNGRYFYHDFKPGVRQQILTDGSVRLYHPSRRIWADDREPGFDRYRHGRRNPGRESAMRNQRLLLWAALGLGAYYAYTQGWFSSTALSLAPTSTTSGTIDWWYDTSTGNVAYSPGNTAPGTLFRPATPDEIGAYT